jgi:putative protease
MVRKKSAKSASRRKKPAVKKALAKRPPRSKSRNRSSAKKPINAKITPEVNLEKIGVVTHYFPHVNAAAVKVLKNAIRVGDDIYIKGHTSDFKERIQSMQLDHVSVNEGKKGQEIGLLVKSRVRIGDSVYRL